MRYQTFSDTEHSSYDVAILAPKLEYAPMLKEYLDPYPFDPETVIAYSLYLDGPKTKADVRREYLDDLLPTLEDLQVKYLVVSEPDYFKILTGTKKTDALLGYVLPNTYPAKMAGTFNVLYCPSYRQVFHNPLPTREKISRAMGALWDHQHGTYKEPGASIIKFADYPSTTAEIAGWLDKLIEMDCDLTCDIEGFSLKHYDAGIGTISFAWNKHEGIAFAVDLGPNPEIVRSLLIRFFRRFQRKMRYHQISYDVTVLIYQLFMDNLIDTPGLLSGLEIMLKNWDCTRLISYLATNSCAGNRLGLKEQAQEFAGNYAVEEIKDIRAIPLPELLEYNLVDCLSTWHVYEKHWDTLITDQQLEIYEDLFKPAMVDIIQMQLTGMPLDMQKVAYARTMLKADLDDALSRLQGTSIIEAFLHEEDLAWVEMKNAKLKKKRVTLADAASVFTPNSPKQKQRLLYDFLELPVIERTKTRQPSTGAEVLEKLKAYTEDKSIRALLDAFLNYAAVDKIYNTFIPAMENAQLAPDGSYYLFGNFNLGGTVSGRLSSSDPNLQTIPSKRNKHSAGGANYAKLIKDCFRAPKGWLMVGLDFASLEDKISALTTKDPNKLKVYEEGFDGHGLRAYAYFGERMPDIRNTVASINSIESKYPEERQDSKGPTFALTYQGTYLTLIAKFGFSKVVALQIEARYHELYKVSDEWVAAKLDEASRTGYITAAFGLRVRTPLLAQVIRGNRKTPTEAEAEGRTAGNALGQSWCLLNSRASVEFMRKVRTSAYRHLVRPIAHIHDAQYYLIPDDMEILLWVNNHLVEAANWQDHPDIAHPRVKLGGSLEVYWPSWANKISIKNHANINDVYEAVDAYFQQRKEAA